MAHKVLCIVRELDTVMLRRNLKEPFVKIIYRIHLL